MKNKKRLHEVSTILISSVDKKIKEGEKNTLLCNFIDIYRNWAITYDNKKNFLLTTATDIEINKFRLKKGQVAITKDSETKYDIGISSYIADDFDDTILGYHTALIIPNLELLDGKYLNAYLNTKTIKNFFEYNATGSGQRYTLSIDVINNIPLNLPKLECQKKIGEFFSIIDRKINLNNKINDNLEKQMKLLYEIFMLKAENKKINGSFVTAKDLVEVLTGKEDANFSIQNGKFNFFTCSNEILKCNEYKYDSSSILIAGNGDFNVKHYTGKFNAYQRTYILTPQKDYYALLYLASLYRIESFKSKSTGSIVKFITKEDIENIPLFIPKNKSIINILNKMIILKENNFSENEILIKLRDFLLPLLMNGQATISE